MNIIALILSLLISFNLYAKTGSITGLEIPRFVSLKSNDVNLRVGPSINYPIRLKYISQNLPVEIIDEFDVWRKTRDHEGNIGWLHKSLIKAAQTIELIKSRKFVKHLMTFDDILPSIMAAKTYNSGSQELLFDQKLYDSETKIWKGKPKKNGLIIPSYLEAHEVYIGNMLSISQDKTTGFISINIEHISPLFAKELLELIIRESNELLRKKDMEESKQGLGYLTSELSKTPFVEIKGSINALIEVQLETQMLAQIHQDYMLIEIEPPFIPEEKSKPINTETVEN